MTVTEGTSTTPITFGEEDENIQGSNAFELFVNAATLGGTLRAFSELCVSLNIRTEQTKHRSLYRLLSELVRTWRACQIWAKLDRRANKPEYCRGSVAANTRVLVIGAGPCGLRAAIECALLGARVVIVEKRTAFTRNNVLHLWPFVIEDLKSLGAKRFYAQFCVGLIDHISIRQLQIILLKIALLLGVEINAGVGFEELESTEDGWQARCSDNINRRADVLIGADGRRNTFAHFSRREFRAKLAIAVTANFRNERGEADTAAEEISGVSACYRHDYFQTMQAATGIELENIVYYKDATHYFVMTAKKASLLSKGVLLEDRGGDARALLAPDNVSGAKLLDFAREAAAYATHNKLPLNFAVNAHGEPDVAMFDFTSLYAADHASRVLQNANGHQLLVCLAGDSLIEPFWPTGSGVGRGFLGSLDAAWAVRQWALNTNPLQVLATRESAYRALNHATDSRSISLDPALRYTLEPVPSAQIKHLIISPDGSSPLPVAPRSLCREQLFQWCIETLLPYKQLKISEDDIASSWRNGLPLAALLHRYRPHLLSFDIAIHWKQSERARRLWVILKDDLGITPMIRSSDLSGATELEVMALLTPLYHLFHDETPADLLPKFNKITDACIPEKPVTSAPRSPKILDTKAKVKRKHSARTSEKSSVSKINFNNYSNVVSKLEPSKDRVSYENISKDDPLPKTGKIALNENEKCFFCDERVFLIERHSIENIFFHRRCFRCHYCEKLLNSSSYKMWVNPDKTVNEKQQFYCQTHFMLRAKGILNSGKRREITQETTREAPRRTLASLLGEIDVDLAIKPAERVEFEVIKPGCGELTEEEMSERNMGPGYNTCGSQSSGSATLSSENEEIPWTAQQITPEMNWREFFSRSKFGLKTQSDDKTRVAEKKRTRRLESDDDADDEETTTELGITASPSSDTLTSSEDEIPQRITLIPLKSKQEIMSNEYDDTETENEDVKNIQNRKRRARRKRPQRENVVKLPSSIIRDQTSHADSHKQPVSLDSIVNNPPNDKVNIPLHRLNAFNARHAFFNQNQDQKKNVTQTSETCAPVPDTPDKRGDFEEEQSSSSSTDTCNNAKYISDDQNENNLTSENENLTKPNLSSNSSENISAPNTVSLISSSSSLSVEKATDTESRPTSVIEVIPSISPVINRAKAEFLKVEESTEPSSIISSKPVARSEVNDNKALLNTLEHLPAKSTTLSFFDEIQSKLQKPLLTIIPQADSASQQKKISFNDEVGEHSIETEDPISLKSKENVIRKALGGLTKEEERKQRRAKMEALKSSFLGTSAEKTSTSTPVKLLDKTSTDNCVSKNTVTALHVQIVQQPNLSKQITMSSPIKEAASKPEKSRIMDEQLDDHKNLTKICHLLSENKGADSKSIEKNSSRNLDKCESLSAISQREVNQNDYIKETDFVFESIINPEKIVRHERTKSTPDYPINRSLIDSSTIPEKQNVIISKDISTDSAFSDSPESGRSKFSAIKILSKSSDKPSFLKRIKSEFRSATLTNSPPKTIKTKSRDDSSKSKKSNQPVVDSTRHPDTRDSGFYEEKLKDVADKSSIEMTIKLLSECPQSNGHANSTDLPPPPPPPSYDAMPIPESLVLDRKRRREKQKEKLLAMQQGFTLDSKSSQQEIVSDPDKHVKNTDPTPLAIHQEIIRRSHEVEQLNRSIEECEISLQQLLDKGMQLELKLKNDPKLKKKDKNNLYEEWLRVNDLRLGTDSKLSDLLISRDQLELENREAHLRRELASRMRKDDSGKSPQELEADQETLAELLSVVEQRDELVQRVERERVNDKIITSRKSAAASKKRISLWGSKKRSKALGTI